MDATPTQIRMYRIPLPRYPVTVLAAVLALGLAGCPGAPQPEGPPAPRVQVLTSGDHCGRESPIPAVEVIADADTLERVLARTGLHLPEAERPDLDRHWLLLVHQGRRPTLGYGVELADPPLLPAPDGPVLQIRARTPQAGAAVGQAITSPCLLLQLPRGGLHGPLQIQDQTGDTWATVQPPGAW